MVEDTSQAYYTKNLTCGRWYAHKGLSAQHVEKWVRRVGMGKFYQDIDMVNSGYQIVLGLCKQKQHHSVDMMQEYLTERSQILENLRQATGLPPKFGKKLFLAIANGSGIQASLDRILSEGGPKLSEDDLKLKFSH